MLSRLVKPRAPIRNVASTVRWFGRGTTPDSRAFNMHDHFFEVPFDYDQPSYRPVVYDQAYPFFGASGDHWNPTKV